MTPDLLIAALILALAALAGLCVYSVAARRALADVLDRAAALAAQVAATHPLTADEARALAGAAYAALPARFRVLPAAVVVPWLAGEIRALTEPQSNSPIS